jgi:hypothetical protein|tara:strand:- start:399 stop:551 length:153 start_codon:yes stop_codon:yes gene_type:complete
VTNLALVAHRFGFSWGDMQTMKLSEVNALLEYMKKENNQQRLQERTSKRR